MRNVAEREGEEWRFKERKKGKEKVKQNKEKEKVRERMSNWESKRMKE